MADVSIGSAAVAGGFLVLGSLVTIAGGFANAWATDKRQADRDRLASRRAREDFQRETLLATQERLSSFIRAHGKVHHFDTQTMKVLGHATQMPLGLGDELLQVRVDLDHMQARIVDPEARQALEAVLEVDMRTVKPTSPDDLEQAVQAFLPRVEEAERTLGEVLRRYLAP